MLQEAGSVTAGLNQLADKLAVPAAHLWAVLVRQAPVYAAQSVVFAAVVAVVVFYWVKFCRWVLKQSDDDLGGLEILAVLGSIAVVLLASFAVVNVIEGLGYLANPEYFAAKSVLRVIKPD